jgi:predicted amidohydrolase
MKLALAQLQIEPAAIDDNVGRAVEAIERAAADGADLVALPELFTVGYFSFDAYSRTAESLAGPTLARLGDVAASEDIALLAGSIVEDLTGTAAETDHHVPETSCLANTAVLFDADGERRLVYRKHHLFGYDSAEQDLLTPGKQLSVAKLGDVTVGVTTCYDLRFPELYRRLVEKGVELVLVPSAWPYPRVEHWRLLPRARAVENLCYVAAANGVGKFDDAELLGRSTVYDPWGTTLASSGDDPTLVTATVDPDRVAEVRTEFPALADRR